jgi:hypothetical protein
VIPEHLNADASGLRVESMGRVDAAAEEVG